VFDTRGWVERERILRQSLGNGCVCKSLSEVRRKGHGGISVRSTSNGPTGSQTINGSCCVLMPTSKSGYGCAGHELNMYSGQIDLSYLQISPFNQENLNDALLEYVSFASR